MLLLLKGLAFTRAGMVALAVMAALSWRAYDVHKQRAVGESRVSAKIEKKVSEHAKTAEDVRRSVSSVAVDRLRDDWTRD